MVGEHPDRLSGKCRDCGESIIRDPRIRARNGTMKPLGLDGLPHRCYHSKREAVESEALWIEQATAYIVEVNRHLHSCQLILRREPKI